MARSGSSAHSPLEHRHRIAYMSHAPMLYDELTALENLRYFSKTGRLRHGLRVRQRIARDGLAGRRTRSRASRFPIAQYSQGMRQRASLARVLQADPEFLLLDEPFSNLDAAGAQQMVELLADFRTWPGKATERTIVLTTHQAHLAAPIADRTLHHHPRNPGFRSGCPTLAKLGSASAQCTIRVRMPPAKTNAARLLDSLALPYELRTYEVDLDDLSAPSRSPPKSVCPSSRYLKPCSPFPRRTSTSSR